MGLNTLQLEFEIQKILYKGNTKLVIYGLQIAREFNISIRKEIIESLLKSPSIEETQALLQYLVVQEPSSIFDYCLVIIEQFPDLRADLAIKVLLLPNIQAPNNSQIKRILTLISRNENDMQTSSLIKILHNASEQIPLKWFAAILEHRNSEVRIESTRLMAITAREELRELLIKAWNKEDRGKPWAGVGLWKLGDPRFLKYVEKNRTSIKLLAYCGQDPQIIEILRSELLNSNCLEAAWALQKLENTQSVPIILDNSLEKAGTVLGLSLFNLAESMDSEYCMNTLQRAIELEEVNIKKNNSLSKLTQLALSTPIAMELENKLAHQKIPENKKQALELNNLNQIERWLAPLIWKKWSESRDYLPSHIPC
ncbi:MAG: hypothetical protein VX619_05085 [bacterium]|nr:hypothetical protein [bacterium]